MEALNLNSFANTIAKANTVYSALQTVLSGEDYHENDLDAVREDKLMQAFLDVPFGDDKEAVLKKLFTAAVIIADDKGVLPFSLPSTNPSDIASYVDEGLSRVKVAYQTSIGNMDSIDAADMLIDQLTVRGIAALDEAIQDNLPVAIDLACEAVIAKYPAARPFVLLIKVSEKFLVNESKVLMARGMHVLNQSAKSAVRKLAEKAVALAPEIRRLVEA